MPMRDTWQSTRATRGAASSSGCFPTDRARVRARTGRCIPGSEPGRSPCVTTTPDNPFLAGDVGPIYARGRPYHHPRSLARLRALLTAADGGCDGEVERA